MKFVIATGNPGKVKDFNLILSLMGHEAVSLKEMGIECDIEEVHDFLNNLPADQLYIFALNDLAKMLEFYDNVKIKKLCADIREGRFCDLDALKNWHYTEEKV